MDTLVSYALLLGTLGFFGYIGYSAASEKDMDSDTYMAARGSQNWLRIGLSLFASGMGIWILFGPSEVGYYGGFWDVVGYAVSAATPFLLLAYVGPMIRKRLPSGVTLADYVRIRLGRPMQVYVGLISVFYMFTFLFAEFTAIGKAMETLSEMEPLIPMAMVGIVTAGYISRGGLPASLATDRVQAMDHHVPSGSFAACAVWRRHRWPDCRCQGRIQSRRSRVEHWYHRSMSAHEHSFESGLALDCSNHRSRDVLAGQLATGLGIRVRRSSDQGCMARRREWFYPWSS